MNVPLYVGIQSRAISCHDRWAWPSDGYELERPILSAPRRRAHGFEEMVDVMGFVFGAIWSLAFSLWFGSYMSHQAPSMGPHGNYQ